MADVAFGYELADGAGGDDLAADGLRCVDADGEAQFASQCFEAVDTGFGVMAEAKDEYAAASGVASIPETKALRLRDMAGL